MSAIQNSIVIILWGIVIGWHIFKYPSIFRYVNSELSNWKSYFKNNFSSNILAIFVALLFRVPFLFLYLGGDTYLHSTSPNVDMAYYSYVSYVMARGPSLLPLHTAYPALIFYIQLPFHFIIYWSGIRSFWVFMLITRILSILFHVLTVIVIGRIVYFISENSRKASFFSMLIFTSFPLITFINTHWGKITHTVPAFFSVLTIFYAMISLKKADNNYLWKIKNSHLAISFLFAGLAFGSKYDAGLMVLIPLIATFMNYQLDTIHYIKGGIVFLFTFILTTPYWIIQPRTYYDGLIWIINYNQGPELSLNENFNLFFTNLKLDITFSFLIFFLIIIGIILIFILNTLRDSEISNSIILKSIVILLVILFAYIVIYALGILTPQSRHFSQFLIIMAILAPMYRLLELISLRGMEKYLTKIIDVGILLIIVFLIFSSTVHSLSNWQIYHTPNTYTMTEAWISSNIEEDASIAAEYIVKIPNSHKNIISLGYVSNINVQSITKNAEYIILNENRISLPSMDWLVNSESNFTETKRIVSNTSQVYYYSFTSEFNPVDMYNSFINSGEFVPGVHGPNFVIFKRN